MNIIKLKKVSSGLYEIKVNGKPLTDKSGNESKVFVMYSPFFERQMLNCYLYFDDDKLVTLDIPVTEKTKAEALKLCVQYIRCYLNSLDK